MDLTSFHVFFCTMNLKEISMRFLSHGLFSLLLSCQMKTTFKETRGMRNNNPLNIRNSIAYKWQGQTGKDSAGFCTFSSVYYGVRAGFALMRTYNRKYQADTIRSIIERFAPATENNTESYIKHVADALGISPDERIHYRSPQMRSMIKAMAKIESCMILDDQTLAKAQSVIL